MPRMAFESCRIRSLPTRVSPRPRKVSRCDSVCPLMPRTSFTFKAAIVVLLNLVAELGELLAAQPGRLFGRAQLAQAVERRLDHVVGVPRPLALGQDVADAHRLEHRA